VSQLEAFVTEQRTNIRFCVLLHISPADTNLVAATVWWQNNEKISGVWHKPFPDGHEIVDELCSGHPSTSTNEENIECMW